MDVITLIEPTEEPLTLDDAKTHLRIGGNDDDDEYIKAIISVARTYIESTLGCALLTQTLRISLDGFPDDSSYRLPRWPIQSIVAVNYTDDVGVAQTFAPTNYAMTSGGKLAHLQLAYDKCWPCTRSITGSVSIDVVAGFAIAAAIPAPIVHAMRLLVGHFYEIRQPAIVGTIVADAPLGVQALLNSQSAGWYQ